jgi:putative hemolysin
MTEILNKEKFMTTTLQQWKENFQLRRQKIKKFRPQFQFALDFGSYLLKTADTPEELIQCFRLRHLVFNQEYRQISGQSLDFDRFDSGFDHLMIVYKKTNSVIGTYRLKCSEALGTGYTDLEFNLRNLQYFPGPYLELGRACIEKEHRRGVVISLLWRGIAEYMNLSGAQTLFGCSSLKITTPREAALVYRYLENEKGLSSMPMCTPTKKYSFSDLDMWLEYFKMPLEDFQVAEAQSLIPPLLNSYLKMGAKILAKPAFDAEFECIDLLTVLNRSDLSALTERKFKVKSVLE